MGERSKTRNARVLRMAGVSDAKVAAAMANEAKQITRRRWFRVTIPSWRHWVFGVGGGQVVEGGGPWWRGLQFQFALGPVHFFMGAGL